MLRKDLVIIERKPIKGGGKRLKMYMDWHYLNPDVRERDLAEKVAERRRYALSALGRPSLRARMARALFALAAAAEKQETWRLAQESSEARGRL